MTSPDTTTQVRDILAVILSEDENSPYRDANLLNLQVPFAEMGINSVDLMEFVLRVEDHFDVSLLDELDPDDLPETLAGWGELVDKTVRST